jgi:WD40 repeat protein
MSNDKGNIFRSSATRVLWRKWAWILPVIAVFIGVWLRFEPLQPCGLLDTTLRLSGCVQALDAHTMLPGGRITDLAFSTDGKILAASSYYYSGCHVGGGVRIWQMSDDGAAHEIEWTTYPLDSMALSADGTIVATGSQDGMQLWRLPSGYPLDIVFEHPGSVRSVAFSPDGAKIVSISSREVRLWNVLDGSLLYTFAEDYPAEPRSLVFSPDGETLAVAAGDVWLWKVADGTLVRILENGASGPMVFSTDGTLLASSVGFEVELRQVSDGALIHVLDGPNYGIHGIAFAPDGKLVIATSGSLLYLWRVSDGVLLRTIETQHELQSVAFSPSGTLAVGTQDGAVLLWSLPEN